MESVAEFLSRGGSIQAVEAGERAIMRDCKCGCRGRMSVHAENAAYTDRRMRDAENQVGHYSAYWGQS